jgi:hypothetical protein
MQSIPELMKSVKNLLNTLVVKDADYQPYADKINLTLAYFENKKYGDDETRLSAVVEDFRVWLNNITVNAAEKNSTRPTFYDSMVANLHRFFKLARKPKAVKLVSAPSFQTVIYQSLIIAAMVKPLNDVDSFTQESLSELAPDQVIYVTHGHFFAIKNLAEYIKTKGVMENYLNRLKFHPQDKLAIIDIAMKKFNIDLNRLNPYEYKVESHPNLLTAAVQIAQQSFAPSADEKHSSHIYTADSAVMTELSQFTNIPIETLLVYQREKFNQFMSLQAASPYIYRRLFSITEAINMSNPEAELLSELTCLHGVIKANLEALKYLKKQILNAEDIKHLSLSQLHFLSEQTKDNGVILDNILQMSEMTPNHITRATR